MIELWNPEGSKWASQVSRNYKMDLDLDDHGARDPKPKEWFDETEIDGRVKKMVEVCRYEFSLYLYMYIGSNHVHLTVRLGFVTQHLWLGNFGKYNRGLRA